jgi:hypothetical protein
MSDQIRRGRRLPFVVMPWWVLDCPELEASDLAVYAAIARHADSAGFAHPSRARIADLARVSIRTVDRAVARLVDIGAIEKQTRRDAAGDPTSNLYLVHETPGGVATQTALPPATNDTTVATPTTLRVATQTTHELEPSEQEPRTTGDDVATGWKPIPSDAKAAIDAALGRAS